jgi:pimeloyl-ACP methyl ester carboxylesterase
MGVDQGQDVIAAGPRPARRLQRAALVAGPPFDGALWAHAAKRLGQHGWAARVLELGPEGGAPSGWAAGLRSALAPDELLVAHGAALRFALRAAAAAEAEGAPLPGLVLCNGAAGAVDPVSRALGAACARPGLGRLLCRPALLQRYLWSSLGLRRAVVNPYVMERDRVVAVTSRWLGAGASTSALAAALVEGGVIEAVPALPRTPVLLLWGDEDPLFPPAVAEAARAALGQALHHRIAGGQHLHIEERPWAAADLIHAWAGVEPAAFVPRG